MSDNTVQERRTVADERGRDRRVIRRISDASLRTTLQQIMWMVRVWAVSAVFFAVAQLLIHYNESSLARNRAIFFAGVIFIIVFPAFRFAQQILSFLRSESQEKLTTIAHGLRMLFFVILVISMILGSVRLIADF
ncbi:MAG: hypothetical protein NDI61_01350 [Bdellovibrionaceae bacterium]|nr:hypothetical protein [Pseudobdellovibrionaceae bacterium]